MAKDKMKGCMSHVRTHSEPSLARGGFKDAELSAMALRRIYIYIYYKLKNILYFF